MFSSNAVFKNIIIFVLIMSKLNVFNVWLRLCFVVNYASMRLYSPFLVHSIL